ncbi:conserved hypothetical protein [uncultured Desulfobacterium sp.]|uniref:Uncharacterized protein n=1 Tax=uncultured Desulfobacterium sp. TaxID=201089 RepID=A0A445MRD5_9BACT|nr:conserved hypothetical protein [uncultured Desulfobacterium sp.]
MMTDTINRLEWRNVRFVPILHNRMEFALEVRRQFEEFRPDIVAAEYPGTLEDKILQGIKRLPLLSVVYYREDDGAFTYLLLEPTDGQVEAVRLALSNNIPVKFIDRDIESYPFDRSPMPDPYSIARIGHFAYCRTYINICTDNHLTHEDMLREKTMAYHLQRLCKDNERVMFVGGLTHIPGLFKLLDKPQAQVVGRIRREGVGLAHLHRDSSQEIMTEIPYLAAEYDGARNSDNYDDLDRIKIIVKMINAAMIGHRKNNKEELSHNQIRTLNRFARNYAFLTGNLVPNFYQLIVAARGAADDNFAYELWEAGSTYPWQTEDPALPVLRLRGEDLFLDQKRIRFHRRLKTMRRRLLPVPVRSREKERYPGQWREGFKGYSICSYPPEDVVIEGYGEHLKKRALEIKSEQNFRVVPFTSSIQDGLDIRETIRDLVKKKIYVREERPLRGKVGSVVVIFAPDLPDKDGKEEFPWCVTWLGEHSQESDMSFYSTPAGELMDGPGISRCQYGGFMLTYPPLRVYDIWKDTFFNLARNKPERLLMAAIDYSLEKHVVYVAATPPSGWCKSLAARLGKTIIYLPIGIFSPVTLKKIRQFHVLDGHAVRNWAPSYIRQ